MKITRRFTKANQDVFNAVTWSKRTSRIVNADGSVVFEMTDAEVPANWSQLATDIMVSKYFRKAGVPQVDEHGKQLRDGKGKVVTGPEKSARQVIHRLAGCWKHWGKHHGYFETKEDAKAFYDELVHMLLHQMAAPNSPQWFNTGLHWAYGITGPAQGHWVPDPKTGEATLADDAYTHPQPHACFIQSIHDDLVNPGGIMDLWTREARLFKYGSGTGTNFSSLRGEDEPLSGGGKSSGLMSWLRIGDRAAGAIKSGGTTRRAAKMVCLDADHPDIEKFVNWKVREELKVAAMVEGMKHLPGEQKELAEQLGLKLDYDFNGEAYYTVSGQNSNNSVRLSDAFFDAVDEDEFWELFRRTDGKVAKRIKARDLWAQICNAAWHCADPGLQYDSTINAWHTCPASGRINASNPCCFAGETLVDTTDGPIRIDELAAMWARSERLPLVKSVDFKKNKPVHREIVRAWKAGDARHCVRVRTFAGLNVVCTPEHRWYTSEGKAVPAAELKPGMYLCAVSDTARLVTTVGGPTPGGPDDPCLDIQTDTVRDVTILETSEPLSVYDIEVRDTHNFAIRPDSDSYELSAIVSNSEYMFLDDTACNLASINLLKFYDAEKRRFDIEGYEHAIRLWTIVLEISVLMAAYPSKEIAHRSWEFRTLGLGYANLGAMLMQAGVPYDSEAGRAICAALSSILTGRAYQASAEMAAELGAFPGYANNREAMLRVMRNHRRAAHGVVARLSESGGSPSSQREGNSATRPTRSVGLPDDYENLRIRPVPINHELFTADELRIDNAAALLSHATEAWNQALALGQKHGYRNAQVTVIAPTGTIGLLMDCDTTGVEPDFALVKFKKLAGGGYFKIANASLRPALKALGYDAEPIDDIVTSVMGTLSLDTPMPARGSPSLRDGSDRDTPHREPVDDSRRGAPTSHSRLGESGYLTFRAFLESCGYNSEDLVNLENQLPTFFELPFAFNAWSMPESVLRKRGVDPEKARKDGSFNGLRLLGLSNAQIETLNEAICGTQTIEGAPHLKPEHEAVFDCANKCGKLGERFIATEGHIRMMAAAQPFVSGAISKTINLPAEASVEDVASAYRLSWELGLKANALYRDGSKLSQPLSTKSDTEAEADEETAVEAALGEASTEAAGASATLMSSTSSAFATSIPAPGMASPAPGRMSGLPDPQSSVLSPQSPSSPEPSYIERIIEKIVERPLRQRLPDTRRSITHRFNVAGHEGYLTVGLYDDGRPGELFITMSKEGSTIGGLMDSLGTAISVALQYGVPVESLVNKFAHQRFEPQGMTSNRDIPFAKSLVDYIFRWMGMEFIPGYREQNAPKRSPGPTTPPTPPEPTDRLASSTMTTTLGDRGLSAAAHDSHDHDHHHDRGGNGGVVETISTRRSEEVLVRSGEVAVEAVVRTERTVAVAASSASALDQANAALMGDAPPCGVCGAITVRNGTCYKCLNCGASMGCS